MKNHCLWLRNQSGNLIAKVSMSNNRMFLLNLKTIEVKCLKVDMRDDAWHWHIRFGRLNFGALKLLGDKYMVNGMSLINH